MIHLETVSKVYQDGTEALSDINLNLKMGSIYLILGENGAGKTTLLKIIANLLSPTSGKVDVDHSRPIGYLGQNFSDSLYNYLTVKENLEYFAGLNNIELKKSKIEKELDYYDLKEIIDNRIFKLSGGQKQIVTFLRTFLHDPDLVILDEPFANIDPERVSQMCGYIKDYSQDRDVLVLISSHTLENIEVIFDEIIFLKNNRLLRLSRAIVLQYLKKYKINHYFVPEHDEEFVKLIKNNDTIFYQKNGQYSYKVLFHSDHQLEPMKKFQEISSKLPTLSDLSFIIKGDYEKLEQMVQ